MSKQSTQPKGGSKSRPATNREPREEKADLSPQAALARAVATEEAKIKAKKLKKNGGARPPKQPKEAREKLCVFAFRLTPEERDLIHKAAGPAKASRFVRSLVVAGALGDRSKIAALLGVEPPEIK